MRPIDRSALGACALSLICLAAAAQDHPGGRPHGPPPEAIAACKGKAVGDSVSFTGRRGETLTGTCQKAGEVLAARPANMPEHEGHGGHGKQGDSAPAN